MTTPGRASRNGGRRLDDLNQLARPFPQGFIERKDGMDYVAHHVVTQRLLSIVGPFDFELVEIIRGDLAATTPDPNGRSRRARAGTPALRNVAVGGVWRLACEVDGRRVRIEEVGDVGDVHNWPHDGARLKDAASDALKRCAMRLGLGLHLWAQEHYFLDHQLSALLKQAGSTTEAEEAAAQRAKTASEPPHEPEPSLSEEAFPNQGANGPGKHPDGNGADAWSDRVLDGQRQANADRRRLDESAKTPSPDDPIGETSGEGDSDSAQPGLATRMIQGRDPDHGAPAAPVPGPINVKTIGEACKLRNVPPNRAWLYLLRDHKDHSGEGGCALLPTPHAFGDLKSLDNFVALKGEKASAAISLVLAHFDKQPTQRGTGDG
jgi:hypothetical protein